MNNCENKRVYYENDFYMNDGNQTLKQELQLAPEDLYPPSLRDQVSRFIGRKREANSLKPEYARRDERNYAFLEDFLEKLFTERNTRTYEVESPRYQAVIELANNLFPLKPHWNLCMDGRVLSILTNGAGSKIGTSTRVPGAMHREFVRGKDGNIFLRPESTFAELLDNGLRTSPNGIIAEIYDSHVGCAAREAEENQAGKYPKDHGLLADVLNKKEIAQATKDYAAKKPGNKSIITIQTSFSPSNGFMYMGLETEAALKHAMNQETAGFTPQVINDLVANGQIISTEQLTQDPTIRQVFNQHGNFVIDWKHEYVESSEKFWGSIQQMKNHILPIIIDSLRSIYPQIDDIESEERAMLLLTNAFSGYLHNNLQGDDISTDKNKYEYGVHREQFIKVYEGGQPPYDISAFVLNPHLKDLADNIELAAKLIRSNRAEGRITDPSENFEDPMGFREAVVPIVMQEIVRHDLPESTWKRLAEINWYDQNYPFPSDWDTMNDEDFYTFLDDKGVDNITVARCINNLRKRVASLYDPDLPTASRLIEQYKVVLPTISGQNRRNYFIVPFTKEGF